MRSESPVVTLLAYSALLVGQLLVLVAYNSGDPSGLQYMFLYMGGLPMVVAATILGLSTLYRRRPNVTLAVGVVLSLSVAFFPDVTGIGYHREKIDRPGVVAIRALIIWQGLEVGRRLVGWWRGGV
jgi:hypothetical protein